VIVLGGLDHEFAKVVRLRWTVDLSIEQKEGRPMNRRPRDRRSPSHGPVDQLASRNSFRYEFKQAVKRPCPASFNEGKSPCA
jgi:hypothetical protein